MTPIEIVNAEMQKYPDNINIEGIGHYLIDKGVAEIPEGKTLVGCNEYCNKKARKFAFRGCARIEDSTVFAWIDEYYGLQHVEKTVNKAPAETDMMDLASFF